MKTELTTISAEQNRNTATIPTMEQLNAFFDEYNRILLIAEKAAEQVDSRYTDLAKGIIWSACERLGADIYETDSIVATLNCQQVEVLKHIRAAINAISMQHRLLHNLLKIEQRGQIDD